ncbi:MAG TPA: MAE_28990/MAE_18760 family HEPN-like nuclease [Candidatus Binatia bacterium]|nr:MAE_28990/MAE_18760 family HEPN-like nuclease [Candidatus Binatia bacterium]
MGHEQLRADIEADILARQEDLRFFYNQVNRLKDEAYRDQMRRALLLLLYAHFEGFVKASFLLHVNAVNSMRLSCSTTHPVLVAATLTDIFDALKNPEMPSPLFPNSGRDSKLVKFVRERQFVERAYPMLERDVRLAESLIDTESNVKTEVLRKLFFKLGFDDSALATDEKKIDELVGRRNNIAHGQDVKGVPQRVYEPLQEAAFRTMSLIARSIMDYMENERYKKV